MTSLLQDITETNIPTQKTYRLPYHPPAFPRKKKQMNIAFRSTNLKLQKII